MLGDESMSEAFLLPGQGGKNATTTAISTATTSSNNSNKRIVSLYDPESMLTIKSSIAQGYITLLSGGMDHNNVPIQSTNTSSSFNKKRNVPTSEQPQFTKQQEEEFMALAYAALTDGNVIDICFGIQNGNIITSSTTKSSKLKAKQTIHERMVKDIKNILQEINSLSDHPTTNTNHDTLSASAIIPATTTIKLQCIQCYKRAFFVIIDHHKKVSKLNVFNRCYQYQKICNETIITLQSIFGPVERSIQDILVQ